MSKIFIKNFTNKTKQTDIEFLFSKVGKVINIIMKNNYAFVEYSIDKDANEAVKLYNDYVIDGSKLTVEFAKSRIEKLAEREKEKCFRCGEYGHWVKDCTIFNRKKRESKRKFARVRKSPRRSFSRSNSCYSSASSERSRSRSRSRKQYFK